MNREFRDIYRRYKEAHKARAASLPLQNRPRRVVELGVLDEPCVGEIVRTIYHVWRITEVIPGDGGPFVTVAHMGTIYGANECSLDRDPQPIRENGPYRLEQFRRVVLTD